MRDSTFSNGQKIRACLEAIDYRSIVENINAGVIVIKDGKVIFANEEFYHISQKTPEQVVNSDFLHLVSVLDREKVTKCQEEALANKDLAGTIEFGMPGGDGETVIEMKVRAVTSGEGSAILGTLTDITERLKTGFELQRTKERLESIIESMHEVVVTLDIKDYSIVTINPSAEALYGIPRRDFSSGLMHVLDFVHPDDMEKVDQFYLNLPETEFDQMEYRIISNNKQLKWVLDEGHVTYSKRGLIRRIVHVIRDITDEKNMLYALRQSEAKYRDFFSSTSDMAFAMTPAGNLIDINDAGLKLLGLKYREEALAGDFGEFFADPSEKSNLLSEIITRGHVESRQVKFKNKEGHLIEVAITARAKVDDAGNCLYHEGMAHNITKALDDQRNRVLRNAAGAMCHYLNTHLMGLLTSEDGLSELISTLVKLIDKLAQGENPGETAVEMSKVVEDMAFFLDEVGNAYKRISEVTLAFNKAFLYKEETYVSGTILDIFKSCGYESDT